MMRRALILCPVFLGLTGCDRATGDAQQAAIRDSAGIRIVENAPLPNNIQPAVVLADEPILVLGELEGPVAEQFGSVVGATRLASGELVIADAKAYQLHFFDSVGVHLRSIGQRGEGPGDFSRMRGLVAGPDDLTVWDDGLRRLTTFDLTTGTRSIRTLENPPRVTSPEGHTAGSILFPWRILLDGRVLATAGRIRFNTPTGNYRDSLDVWLADSGGVIAQVGTVFTRAHYVHETPDGSVTFGGTPFGPTGTIAMTDEGWLHSDGAHFEVRQFDIDARLLRIVRVRETPALVTDEDRIWFRDSLLAEYPGETLEHERLALEFAEWSDTMPAYAALVHDATGTIWARRYQRTATTATWDLFSPDGTLLGLARVPADLVIREIGADYLLAQRKGELDEPLVVLYRLTRH